MGWVRLLIGWVALRTGRLPRALSCACAPKGTFVILQFVPQPLTIVEMLLGITSYQWLGIVLLRSKS